ncbi:hypothetical protein AAA450_09230 [Staphylococcus equorum]|uniref:hypothetical protein n=1 Tax=Staphylococcus equorum TaxID=246432 RepID=UPI003D80860C
MKSNFLFETLNLIATLILSSLLAYFYPDGLKINEDIFAVLILIIGFLIYIIIKFLFASLFPLKISSDISNNKSPQKESTHISYSNKHSLNKEIKLELKIKYKYLSKLIQLLIKWLLKDTNIYLTLETSEESVFLRGDSFKVVEPFNNQNAKINLNSKIQKIVDINDLNEKNEDVYNIYIRVAKGCKVSLETNIVSNLLIENENNNYFKNFLLNIFTKKKYLNHKIYIYEQELK